MDLHAVFPSAGRQDFLEADALLDIGQADALQLLQDQRPEAGLLALPVDHAGAVGDRHQDVKRAVAGRGQRRVGDAGVLDVEARARRGVRSPSSISLMFRT